MKVVVTNVPEVKRDEEKIKAAAADAAAARARYVAEVARIRRDCPAVTDDHIKAMETHATLAVPSLQSALAALREAKTAEAEARRVAAVKPRPAHVRIVVVGGYDHREALKASGYRFAGDAIWHDPLGMRVTSGWVKIVTPDAAETELGKLRQLDGHLVAKSE